MPIKTEWYNTEKTILYIKYSGIWTLEEYHNNIMLNSKMITEQPHWVASIGDFSEGQSVPSRFLSSGQHSENITPSNNAGMILFGLNSYMTMLAKMFAKVFPKSTQGMVIASNQEEALLIAQKILLTVQKQL